MFRKYILLNCLYSSPATARFQEFGGLHHLFFPPLKLVTLSVHFIPQTRYLDWKCLNWASLWIWQGAGEESSQQENTHFPQMSLFWCAGPCHLAFCCLSHSMLKIFLFIINGQVCLSSISWVSWWHIPNTCVATPSHPFYYVPEKQDGKMWWEKLSRSLVYAGRVTVERSFQWTIDFMLKYFLVYIWKVPLNAKFS